MTEQHLRWALEEIKEKAEALELLTERMTQPQRDLLAHAESIGERPYTYEELNDVRNRLDWSLRFVRTAIHKRLGLHP